MRTTKYKMPSVVLLVIIMLAAQTAFAYYNPSTGQWLSRDPIGEPGFQTLQMAQGTSQARPAQVARQSSRWVSRGPVEETLLTKDRSIQRPKLLNEIMNLIAFVKNNPGNSYDVSSGSQLGTPSQTSYDSQSAQRLQRGDASPFSANHLTSGLMTQLDADGNETDLE
jgi:hypothetical protein